MKTLAAKTSKVVRSLVAFKNVQVDSKFITGGTGSNGSWSDLMDLDAIDSPQEALRKKRKSS